MTLRKTDRGIDPPTLFDPRTMPGGSPRGDCSPGESWLFLLPLLDGRGYRGTRVQPVTRSDHTSVQLNRYLVSFSLQRER